MIHPLQNSPQPQGSAGLLIEGTVVSEIGTARSPISIGSRQLATRFFLAPLAGYTHLAFRLALRRIGGLGLATTDLVLASMLWSERRKSLELVQTCAEDRPLSAGPICRPAVSALRVFLPSLFVQRRASLL